MIRTIFTRSALGFAMVVTSALSLSAFAQDTKIQTPEGSVEQKTDTSKNVITGSTTTTEETETKNINGKTTSKRVRKAKKDKHGHLIKKEGTTEQMDANGNTVTKEHSEETTH